MFAYSISTCSVSFKGRQPTPKKSPPKSASPKVSHKRVFTLIGWQPGSANTGFYSILAISSCGFSGSIVQTPFRAIPWCSPTKQEQFANTVCANSFCQFSANLRKEGRQLAQIVPKLSAQTVIVWSRFVLFLFLGLLAAPARNSPERVCDTLRTFPEKVGNPQFTFSQKELRSPNSKALSDCKVLFKHKMTVNSHKWRLIAVNGGHAGTEKGPNWGHVKILLRLRWAHNHPWIPTTLGCPFSVGSVILQV